MQSDYVYTLHREVASMRIVFRLSFLARFNAFYIIARSVSRQWCVFSRVGQLNIENFFFNIFANSSLNNNRKEISENYGFEAARPHSLKSTNNQFYAAFTNFITTFN